MDLGDWAEASAADWRRSMDALNKSTSYEHYVQLLLEAATRDLVAEIESELRRPPRPGWG